MSNMVPDRAEMFRQGLGRQSDLALVLVVIGILGVLFTPIPASLLDFLFISNICFALLILLITFYVETPLQFSTFPSLLLIATLFRLSLNVAATRLILGNANAGRVIDSIGNYVVGGNYVIGIIVFLVLVVVQYVVVTNGAQRVAEVAARFTLDAMPGKQMSIDADLNMGLINEKEAQKRRTLIQREANFYGAMDGASKFVKGDAIAGIIIILIDIIGGLAIGVGQMDMAWDQALKAFTLLTIGDGIVTQVPALVLSTGTGIIVTRAASDSFLSQEIGRQVIAYPKTLLIICVGLIGALLTPRAPAVPVLLLLAFLGPVTLFAFRRNARQVETELQADSKKDQEEDLYGTLAIDPIEVTVGQELIALAGGEDNQLMDRIGALRKRYALEAGFVIPKVRVKDDKRLAPHAYQIKIFGAKSGEGEILPDRVLAINPGSVREALEGIETRDPTYGLAAVWIVEEQRRVAKAAGYTVVDPVTVLATHLTEVIRRQSSNLLTRAETERLVNRVRTENGGLVEEVVPSIMSLSDIQKVLQHLLRENISIRNLEAILEVLADAGKLTKDAAILTELVREKLGPIICQGLVDEQGSLNVIVLDPSLEQVLASGVRGEGGKQRLLLEPALAQEILSRIAGQMEKMVTANLLPVLLCAPELRRHLWTLTERIMPHLSILSMAEVPSGIQVKSFALVKL